MDDKKNATPAVETRERQGDEGGGVAPPADAVLTEKDIHCIARVLQGCIYKGRLFACCEKYCRYVADCTEAIQQGRNLYFNTDARKHLEEASGVYLGPLSDEQLISGEKRRGEPPECFSQANPMQDSGQDRT